jgi:hypothetical protein
LIVTRATRPLATRTFVYAAIVRIDAASDHLDGAVRTFVALALADVGRECEAVAVALAARSEYLPRYNRSVARYARQLTADPP